MNQAITDTTPLDEDPLPTVSIEAPFELGPTIRATAELDNPEPEPAGLVAVEVDHLAAGQQHGRLMAKMFGLETEPERLGHYVLLEELGRGGMGVVYAAYDHKLDRKVAIKLIQARRDEAAQQRLMREAKAMAQLSHPNVVQVHEISNTQDMTFIVMEYISGQTLGEWLADDDVPRIRASILSTFIRAGRGLAAAHEAGLVHRDFKPDNVMLGDDGRVRVLDFGLARADGPGVGEQASTSDEPKGTSPAALDGHLTRTGAVLGTPAYMPLEQLRGRPADARSDQFSFCEALHEALYGERPFAGRTLSDLMDSVSGGEVLPAAKNSTVPGWLREVVVQGLRPEPAERWPSMAELLAALADDPSVRRRKRWLAAGMVGLLAGGAWGVATTVEHDAQICKGMEAKLEGVWDDARRAEVEAAFEAGLYRDDLGAGPAVARRLHQRLGGCARAGLRGDAARRAVGQAVGPADGLPRRAPGAREGDGGRARAGGRDGARKGGGGRVELAEAGAVRGRRSADGRRASARGPRSGRASGGPRRAPGHRGRSAQDEEVR